MNTFLSAHPDCIHSRQNVKVDRIVIHTMEGTFKGTQSWFQQGKDKRPVPTAAHYLISKEGDICQMVPDEMMCYHAGSKTQPQWNERSIGIEHEGHATDEEFSLPMIKASAKVAVTMVKKFGITCDENSIIGHQFIPGVTHHDPGPNWPWELYRQLIAEELANS